ncbi:bifunctional 4-hydroxy-2-oxoglutarate aldolase/2-dehydro-3-deoxy-phosphogluconate aldolase [Streptococcus sp. zg-86]|uniref:Bifunctional 4-hydroxy-2-oxoglutarate aldolase/2-dehydro-3-deoxy-phosphogluconate aldolase n=1 Tax=Streptococcus zhangguiae TaxID=2664091 RepID=A0A6I4R6R4_9STRE|nr:MULTISPECIES: bifunctional 4-hydroxy-2-oxoglutarate aldolase/2-dehydro-3-deoxy-phosphogluconate aldolase [unclassified Streptococcus]MTB63536.1 bifunctional 4-hydroxy-2-oxoglutarate aldolase/2-dehydro-3-deoxy-phosphogluconate aldolase [Streptococcus sp. zg-86]MTB89815.1 bifunctional 4-hydroxy-2-oxoglutarate aldolase/2-dehydro-3-deoxy-phosphogluconate aldolase [Streptococcus sp. zg-36]MWV55486.1 bifunctional 4-hydroxy-2-oxoglutarate aldolase/2-dehydro-3-deoxy-phosphogluconate aldolase [Strepto
MGKSDTISTLRENKVVVVIRGATKEEGIRAAIACVDGGIKAIEVAYTNQYASEIIQELRTLYTNDLSVCIGAGTVLDAVTARQAILAGANYIVSPSFHLETAKICNLYTVPYIPGCMTLTEMTVALEAGSELVKLFPGSAFGPKYIAAIKAPLPQVGIMVTGGVSLENAAEWFQAGVDAVGIGGEFNTLASQGRYDKISEIAKQYRCLI